MKYIKKLEVYYPKEKLFGDDIVYLTDGQSDWYQLQHDFQENTMKVMFEDDGLITACSRDVSALFPVGCGVAEINTNKTDLLGLYLINGKLVDTPKPSEFHEWNGTNWEISPEKLTALFTQRKDNLLSLLANRADQLKTGLLVGYPQTEIESFYRQEKEALAWQADNSTVTPMLTQIAKLRDMPFEILVQKVIEKSNQFAVAIGMIIGQRQKFEDRLLVATTIEQLDELEKEINEWQFQVN